MRWTALAFSFTFLVVWVIGDLLLGGGVNLVWLVIGLLVAVVVFAAVASIHDINPF